MDATWISVEDNLPSAYKTVAVRCVDYTTSNNFVRHSLGWCYDIVDRDRCSSFSYVYRPPYTIEERPPHWVWQVDINPLCGPDTHKYTVTHWKDIGI